MAWYYKNELHKEGFTDTETKSRIMGESEFQRCVLRALHEMGVVAVRVTASSKRGVPDVLACVCGKFVGLELKRKGYTRTSLSAQQIKALEKINADGGYACYFWDVKDVREFVTLIREHKEREVREFIKFRMLLLRKKKAFKAVYGVLDEKDEHDQTG